MRNIKIGYLLILLIFFLNGVTRSIGSPHNSYIFSKQSQKDLKVKSKSSTDACDEKIITVRKRKLRGVEVIGVQISDIIFVGVFTYPNVNPVYSETVYTSFRYCVNPKRGPPLA